MIKNYLKTTLRNLGKNKIFSFINIAGMTLGIASFLLLGVFVVDELSYDNYHPEGDRTYRVYNLRTGDDGETNQLPIVPPTFAPTMQSEFPEVASTLRIIDTYGDLMFDINDEQFFKSNGFYAEPTIFDMLSIQLKEGNVETALNGPNQLVISSTFAENYFKDKSPLGETIMVSGTSYEVTGVYNDISRQSHLTPEFILSFETVLNLIAAPRMESWGWQQFFTYIKLSPGADVEEFSKKWNEKIIEVAHPQTETSGYTYLTYFQNVKDVYLHSSGFEWEIANRGNIQTVYTLSAVALFLIIIVCLNFVNLSTAKSLNRIKEVGIRKVIGANRKQLIVQFLGESMMIAFVSMLLAGLVAEVFLPYLNGFTGKNVSFHFLSDPFSVGFMLLFALLLGALAGIYPAIYASGFESVSLLKGFKSGKGAGRFRYALVLVQFTLTIFLIIGSLVVYNQLNYLKEKDLGFNKEQVVVLPLRRGMKQRLEPIKNEFLKNSNITSASYSFGLPGDIVAGDGIVDPITGKQWPANHFMIDTDYIKTLDLKILAGRDFSSDLASDSSQSFILNETAVYNLGLGTIDEAIGKELHWHIWGYHSWKKGTVIGVVQDFHFKSLKEKVSTSILQIYPSAYQTLALKVSPQDMSGTLKFIEDKWVELAPDWPFSYKFLDDNFAHMYTSEERLGTLFTIFTALGIFIACLGLFGLVYYTIMQKYREIGIRKVLGAEVASIVFLIMKKFGKLILISLILAVPLSHYLSQNWLTNFSYRITLNPMIYVFAGLIMTALAALTIGYQSIKAAMSNPVDSLRSE